MPALVPTLASSLIRADGAFRARRTAAARKAYEVLLERAQEKSDRATEVTARIMLAWCALRARDLDAATDLLELAREHVDPAWGEGQSRLKRVSVRLAIATHGPSEARQQVRDYLSWAEQEHRAADVLDACLLLAGLSEVSDRVEWLERGIEAAVDAKEIDGLGRAYNELAAARDQLGESEAALEAYEQALEWHRKRIDAGAVEPGAARTVTAATWAVGASACRNENWPLARERLEAAMESARTDDSCADLLGWILSDLARVYEAAGDIVGARHVLVEALESAREHDLAALWPERYEILLDQAEALEIT